MNYLAHLYLARHSDGLIVGGLLGDFVRGTRLDGFPPEVQAGIRLHRRIDACSDRHPIVRESKLRIGPGNRRYAGVLVDVFYDHFLARSWDAHSDLTLPDFASSVYATLAAAALPEAVRGMVVRMAEQDWLTSYARIDGIEAALARIARRIRRENGVAGAAADLLRQYDAFASDFERFFPEICALAPGQPSRPGPGGAFSGPAPRGSASSASETRRSRPGPASGSG